MLGGWGSHGAGGAGSHSEAVGLGVAICCVRKRRVLGLVGREWSTRGN